MSERRATEPDKQCSAITAQGTQCPFFGYMITDCGRWCGHHQPNYGTVPMRLDPMAGDGKRLKARPTPDHVHGTLNGYTNHGCRCDRCKEASREYRRQRRAGATRELAAGLVGVDHGTTNAYANYGCRCRPCTDAAVAAKSLTSAK